MRTRSLALLFLSLLLSTGCTVTVTGGGGWTPVGSDIKIYGDFDVARPGLTLTDACADAGIDWVELVILDSTGTYEWDSGVSGLWAFCGDGFIDSVTPVVASGNYQYLWRAYDINDNLLEETAPVAFGPGNVDIDGYVNAVPAFFGDVYLDITLNYEDYDTADLYGTCASSTANLEPFVWTLYDAHPDSGGVALYTDGGDSLCPDYIVIDDAFDDLMYAGYTYYLELYSTNLDVYWETICAIDVDFYGETLVTCDVPIYFGI